MLGKSIKTGSKPAFAPKAYSCPNVVAFAD
jgi:hypothetical protein